MILFRLNSMSEVNLRIQSRKSSLGFLLGCPKVKGEGARLPYSHCTPTYSPCTPMYFASTPLVLPCTSHVLPSTPLVLPCTSHLLPLYFLILLEYFGVYEVPLLPPCETFILPTELWMVLHERYETFMWFIQVPVVPY